MPAGNGALTERACNILKACRKHWEGTAGVCEALGKPYSIGEVKVALEAMYDAGLVERRQVMTRGRPRAEYRVAPEWRNDA